MAAGDGGADDHVVLSGEAREQDLETGEQDHEEARPPLASQPPYRATHLLWKLELTAPATKGLNSRAWKVCRKVEGSESAPKLATPVGELRFQNFTAKPVPLPDGEVSILNGQRRQ